MADAEALHHRVRCLNCGHKWMIDYEATDAARSHAVLAAKSCPVCGGGPAAAEASDGAVGRARASG
ncbi:MAG TPA: hypothetical protein VFO41_05530 [Alphaproteobacteria bacterium]|nr:hypothetical protein [Alphaproteobacteria bacterium]